MALYKVYKISNNEDLFARIPKKEDSIKHQRFKIFKINNHIQHIICTANDSIKSIFSPENNIFFDDINIEVLIVRHKFLYCIVSLSGKGLMSLRGINKYIVEEILNFIQEYLKNKYDINIKFIQFEYNNYHFSKDYWGDNITSKYGYNSLNKMHIKISSSNFNKLIEKYPDLDKYYTNGTIKSIKGKSSDLEYIEEDKRNPGNFKFNRDGIFNCNFENIIFFNNFIIKLIDKGFFEDS